MQRWLWLGLLLACAKRPDPGPPPEPLPLEVPVDIAALWNYADPEASEAAFLGAADRADGELQLELWTQAARARVMQRRFDEARALLDGVDEGLGEEMPRAGTRLLLERGRLLRSSGDAPAAKPLFVEAWELGRAHGLDYLAVDAAHMVGIVAGGDEAVRWQHDAMQLAEASADPATKGWLGPLYNNLGWTFFDSGDPARALDLWQRGAAWHAERKTGRPEQIARWTVARGLRALDRADEALTMQRRLLDELTGQAIDDGFVHEELGELLHAAGDPEARSHFARAYALLSKEAWLVEREPERVQRLAELGAAE